MTKNFIKKLTFSPLCIALTYFVLASAWVLFTDLFINFKWPSDSVYTFFQTFKGIFFVVVTSIVVFVMTNRSFKTQKHLSSVLTVLSDVNQLIVREKDINKLLKKSCDILASSHIYKNAWIMTLDENKRVNHLIYSDSSKEFELFREKVKTHWRPNCICEVAKTDKLYNFTKDLVKECANCPLTASSNYISAFTIELKHEEELYGYLNIYMDKEHIDDNKELALLKELAGDISYAISNLKVEEELVISSRLLEQRTKDLETVILEAPNPIMVHNEDGKVILINRVWEQLTGYKHQEIDTIEKWTKKAYGKQMSVIKEYIDKLYNIEAKVDEGEYHVCTKSKKIIIWQFSSASLGLMNGNRTVISSAMDITELKHKDTLLQMQSRHAAMGEMIGMIAHQWRQPISIVAMVANNILLDIALNSFDANKAEKYSHSILEQTSHLSKTIDDFRNFFKSDKDLLKVKLPRIIEDTLNIVHDSLINNSIELQTSFDSDSLINAYPRELMQVFINIINNAKDAILLGNIEKPIIKIKVYDDEKYVNTEICDNAKGIDKTVLKKVFEPYFTTKDEKTGTGLGLYMSKIIIEKHLEGVIEVFNKEDGACFRVRLLK